MSSDPRPPAEYRPPPGAVSNAVRGYLARHHFVVLPSAALSDREVSACAWAVLSAVCLHADRDRALAFPTLGRLAAISGCDRTTTLRALSVLTARGHLERSARQSKYGARQSNLYRVVSPRDFAACVGALEDQAVPASAWRVLSALASRADGGGRLTWPVKSLSSFLGVHVRTVPASAELLRERGWLEVVRPKTGRYARVGYRLLARRAAAGIRPFTAGEPGVERSGEDAAQRARWLRHYAAYKAGREAG